MSRTAAEPRRIWGEAGAAAAPPLLGSTHTATQLHMPLKISHTGDTHLDEDRYFGDTARCLEWFVADSISSGTDLFVINGDLTTYKATIRERNLWIEIGRASCRERV